MLEGRLVNSLNGDPLAGATVVIDELKREVVSGADGTFRFDNLTPGTYHVWVRAQGYSSRRTEVTVPDARRRSCRAPRRFRSALPGSRVGQRRNAQPVRRVPTDDGAVRTGADQAAGKLARRDAREPAGHRLAQLRLRAFASGHPRAGWRSRADSAGWPAHRRFVEPVGRPRRQRQSCRRRKHRSCSRAGHVVVRSERHRRSRQHHHERDSDTARPGRIRGSDVRRRDCRRGSRRRPGTCSSATASSP